MDQQRLAPQREVDVAVIDHADPLFLKKITESCRLLVGSPRRLAELRMTSSGGRHVSRNPGWQGCAATSPGNTAGDPARTALPSRTPA
jgi:hypothetical protein